MGCLEHLKICGASCCKRFELILPESFKFPEIKKQMMITKALNKDQIKYYKLHACIYNKRTQELIINIEDYKIENNRLIILNRCKALTDDLLCSLHGEDEQPTICHKPNEKEHENLEGVRITDNCLYKK